MFSKLNGFTVGDTVIVLTNDGNYMAKIQSFLGFREDTDNGVRLDYNGMSRYHRMSEILKIELYSNGQFVPYTGQ